MADYWISFRITSDATYQRRYTALIAALNLHATLAWEGDTSMIAIRTASSIDAVGASIKAALNGTTDHAVIREIKADNVRYINNPGTNFLTFFPSAIKL
jgi:hypothetical protein